MSAARTPAARRRSSACSDSPLHGQGVFAARRIAKGTRIIEYLGERVSHAEADRRYADKDSSDNHTFLFIVDRAPSSTRASTATRRASSITPASRTASR